MANVAKAVNIEDIRRLARRRLPRAIFDYIDGGAEDEVTMRENRRAFEEISQFERQLADDGTVIVKFFLHISKKEQRRRLKKLKKDKFESWRVTKWDWKHHKDYNKYVKAIEEMVAKTDAPYAPWAIVEATDGRYAEIKVFETLVKAMENAVEWRKAHGVEIGRTKVAREAKKMAKSPAKEKSDARKSGSQQEVA